MPQDRFRPRDRPDTRFAPSLHRAAEPAGKWAPRVLARLDSRGRPSQAPRPPGCQFSSWFPRSTYRQFERPNPDLFRKNIDTCMSGALKPAHAFLFVVSDLLYSIVSGALSRNAGECLFAPNLGTSAMSAAVVNPAGWAVRFYEAPIGKKAVMAITGIMLVGYVLAHMLGNLQIYSSNRDQINTYAAFLHNPASAGLLWVARTVKPNSIIRRGATGYLQVRCPSVQRPPRGHQRERERCSHLVSIRPDYSETASFCTCKANTLVVSYYAMIEQSSAIQSPGAALSTIDKAAAPLRRQVLDELRQSIIAGRLAPGARLVERELTAMMGVSRTVVREALRQLESEGLISIIPHKRPVVD